MGMIDYVYFSCPVCGNRIQGQSKGREWPEMSVFQWEDAPWYVKTDMLGRRYTCPSCSVEVEITGTVTVDASPVEVEERKKQK